MSDKIIIIQKKNKKSELTDNDFVYIQKVLEYSCQGDTCVSKKVLFENLKEPLKLKIEQYKFEQLITKAVRAGKLPGFQIRSGRDGGLCREGTIKRRDKKVTVKKTEIIDKLKPVSDKLKTLANEISNDQLSSINNDLAKIISEM